MKEKEHNSFEICPTGKCTACGACVNICPMKAISFKENEYGELHPFVDLNKCTGCGLCQKRCPNNNPNKFNQAGHCFAAWILDNEKRAECASGGVATMLSEYVVTEKKGVVFGTAYDANMIPRVTWVDALEGVEKLKGSKYVKSVVGADTFKKVLEFLDEDRYVLFIGTPCQISGLLSFLGGERENLLTVDLLCHGVCPVNYFISEIEYLKARYKIENVSNIRFRGNDEDNSLMTFFDRLIGRYNSNNYKLSVWTKDRFGKPLLRYRGGPAENYYLAGFMKGISLRENCYSCSYARPERISDLTIGDFIGLGQEIPFEGPLINTSVVLTNSRKGEVLYSDVVEKKGGVVSMERPFSERLSYPFSLTKPFPHHILAPRFRKLYRKIGYRSAIVKVLWVVLLKERIFGLLAHFSRLPGYAVDKIMKKIKNA